MKNTRTTNTYSINFLLSVSRLAIYKSKQNMVFENKQIDTSKLFFIYNAQICTACVYLLQNEQMGCLFSLNIH